ncbi:hypothetical protein [Rappaport israeli]|nr:hypothetical protein [Rappaport israeli]
MNPLRALILLFSPFATSKIIVVTTYAKATNIFTLPQLMPPRRL